MRVHVSQLRWYLCDVVYTVYAYAVMTTHLCNILSLDCALTYVADTSSTAHGMHNYCFKVYTVDTHVCEEALVLSSYVCSMLSAST